MLSFALVLRYYGEEPLETIQFTDIMPCILEYRDNVHIYHSIGTNYSEVTDQFTVELSTDGKTIWFTSNGSLLVKDSESIGVVFDVEVVGVTGTCHECGEVFNYGCVSGRIGCTKDPNFFMEDYLQINSGCPSGNCPPSIPSIRGPTNGVVGEELEFHFITYDPDDDQVYYMIDFGDIDCIPTWQGPYASGNEISVKYTFSSTGTFKIIAKAKDTEDHESGWTPMGYEHVVVIVSQGEPCIEIDPESHDFGTIEPGLTDSTTFEIWNDNEGTLTYSLSESSDWLELSTTSGESTGEHDTITVEINTTGLSEQMHTCDIQITSNGGDEVFTVTVNVAEESQEEPELSILPPSLLNIDHVEATIENIGGIDVANVDWEINITGGLLGLVTIENSGTIAYLVADGSETISSNEPVVANGMLPFGLGRISGTIKASVGGDYSIEEPVGGFIIGKYIIIMGYAP